MLCCRGAAVVTFDHQGFGNSSEPHLRHSSEDTFVHVNAHNKGGIYDMALDCVAVAQDACRNTGSCAWQTHKALTPTHCLGDSKFHLFGVSMGGYIAMTAAATAIKYFEAEGEHFARHCGLVVGCSHFGGPNRVLVAESFNYLCKEVQKTPCDMPEWKGRVRELFAMNFTPEFCSHYASKGRFEQLLEPYEQSMRENNCSNKSSSSSSSSSSSRFADQGMEWQFDVVNTFYEDGMEDLLSQIKCPTLIVTGIAQLSALEHDIVFSAWVCYFSFFSFVLRPNSTSLQETKMSSYLVKILSFFMNESRAVNTSC